MNHAKKKPASSLPIEAFLLDCDGTLVDSERVGSQALHAVGQRFGAVIDEALFYERSHGRDMARVLEILNAHSPTPMPEHYAQTARAHQAQVFQQSLQAMPGALGLLQALRDGGIPFAVVTNGPREKVELTLGLTGLLPLFQSEPPRPVQKACDGSVLQDRILSAYEMLTFKPQPELFLIAARALGVKPSRCAVVEDSASGLRAALAAGMQVFSLLPQAQLPEDLQRASLVFIQGLADIHAIAL